MRKIQIPDSFFRLSDSHIKDGRARPTFKRLKKRFWYSSVQKAHSVSFFGTFQSITPKTNMTGDIRQSTVRVEGIKSNRLYRC